MQKQVLIAREETSFKIHAESDVVGSTFLTKLLFEYVEHGKLDFELKSKKGSIVSEILVNVAGGLFSAVLYDLIKKLYTRLKDQKTNGKEVKPVHIFTTKEEFIITGDKNSELPEELKKELL